MDFFLLLIKVAALSIQSSPERQGWLGCLENKLRVKRGAQVPWLTAVIIGVFQWSLLQLEKLNNYNKRGRQDSYPKNLIQNRIANFWLPDLDARRNTQHQVIHMVVKMYIRRYKGNSIRFGLPFPERPQKPKRIYQNIIYEGIKLQAFINDGPSRLTWTQARKELNISESKLAHLLKIVNQLPQDFVENMRSCDDPRMLKTFTGRALLKISRLKTAKEQKNEINHLLESIR